MESSSESLAQNQESEVLAEVNRAAEHAKRTSFRTDDQSLREARVSSGIAAIGYLNFFASREQPRVPSQPEVSEGLLSTVWSWRDQVKTGMRSFLSGVDRTRPEHTAALDRAATDISGLPLDLTNVTDLVPTESEEDDQYPDHINTILNETFYLGEHLPCNCDGHSRFIRPLDRYMCALRLDCQLSLHGNGSEYFFDTVFAQRHEQNPSWSLVRFQISKNQNCVGSEAEPIDLAASLPTQRLKDFCGLLASPLGSSCILPLRFGGGERTRHLTKLDVLTPDINLGRGNGISLQRVLEDRKPPAAGRLILAYLVARSFWQYYQSDWMKTSWNSETIQFLPEDVGDSESAFNIYAPFLELQTSDQLSAAPKEFESEYGYVHKFPRILILGLMLFQICSQSPYRTQISNQFSAPSVNKDCFFFHRSKTQGTWPALDLDEYYVSAYKNIVAECFPVAGSSNFGGTLLDPKLSILARRALIRKKVVVPLHGLLQGMGLFNDDSGLLSVVPRLDSQVSDETIQFDPEAQEFLIKIGRSWLAQRIRNSLNRDHLHPPRSPLIPRPRIAIIDTGYDPESSFLTLPHKKRLQGHWKDYWEGTETPKDDDGHGTSMLSLVLKIASVADIYVARIAGNSSHMLNQRERTSRNLAEAIDWAVREHNVDIVSMSLGWSREITVDGRPVVSNAISEALRSRDQKVLFFAAASNFGGGTPEMFPASHRNVFSIRGTNARGFHPDFNPSLSKIDRFALGTLGYKVPTARRGNTLIPISRTGTSVATAITAGLVALVLGYINTCPAEHSWQVLKSHDKMLFLLEALSEEPETGKRFITPDKFPLFSDSETGFAAVLTAESTK